MKEKFMSGNKKKIIIKKCTFAFVMTLEGAEIKADEEEEEEEELLVF